MANLNNEHIMIKMVMLTRTLTITMLVSINSRIDIDFQGETEQDTKKIGGRSVKFEDSDHPTGQMNLKTLISCLKWGREVQFDYLGKEYFLDSAHGRQHVLWKETTQIGEEFTDVTEENLSKLYIEGKSVANIFKDGEALVTLLF